MSTKVLVVGLGGIGSEITAMVERLTSIEQKKYLRFAIVDTDINTINRLRRNGFSGAVVQLSDNMTVGQYLENNEDAKEIGRAHV